MEVYSWEIIYFYGPFSTAMLNNQRVYIYVVVAVVDEDEDEEEDDDSNEYSDDAEEEEEEDMMLIYFVISRLHFSVMFVVCFPVILLCYLFFSVSYIYALLLSRPISVHGTQNETLRPSTQKQRAHVLEWCCN